MEDPPPTGSVRLVIKNPAHEVEDQTIVVLRSSTVGSLKAELVERYPGRPPPHDQKLIFAGRILEDFMVFDDVLRQHDTSVPQTLHLVVPRTPVPPTGPPPAPTHPTGGVGVVPAVDLRAMAAWQVAYAMWYQQYGELAAAAAMARSPPAAGAPTPTAPTSAQAPQHLHHLHPLHAPHIHPGVAADQAHVQLPPQQVPPGPPGPPGPGFGHYMKVALKLAFLVLIFTQGGEWYHILLLSMVAFIVFLFQVGVLRINVEAREAAAAADANAPRPEAAAEDAGAPAPPVDPQPGLRLWSPVHHVVTFVGAFFASLLPSWQPPVPPPPPVEPDPQQEQGAR